MGRPRARGNLEIGLLKRPIFFGPSSRALSKRDVGVGDDDGIFFGSRRERRSWVEVVKDRHTAQGRRNPESRLLKPALGPLGRPAERQG